MSSSNCCFLTCIQISQEAGQVVWYSHLFQNFPQFIVIHTIKGFSIVNKAEIDVFLELSCFFNDPAGVGNMIFGSSAFSKPSLYIWKLLVHVLLKYNLKDFEPNHAHVKWVQLYGSLNILWHCPSLELEWKLTFFRPVATAVFQICWHIECSTFTASSFRIWNGSTGIPSPPLALFLVMLPKAHLTCCHIQKRENFTLLMDDLLPRSSLSLLESSLNKCQPYHCCSPQNR